jgi:ferritin-like metal-binding protein YciE
MSDNQQILKKLEAQDKMLKSISDEQALVRKEFQEYKQQMEPIKEIFESVSGFNSIAVWILKGLLLFGAGIGMIYGFIKFLKT